MPISVEAFMALAEEESPSRNGKGPGGPSKWDMLFQPHPESGGPFGGRDAALTALVGMMRRKRVPYEPALNLARMWDHEYCEPPLGFSVVNEKMSRAWYEWAEGSEPDATPETANAAGLQFMTLADMVAFEEEAGAMLWLLENVLPEGGLVYFSAPPAGAKTWVMLDLVRAFVTGTDWLGKYHIEKRGVLYVDEEMGVRKALPRMRKLGMPVNAEGFWYTNKAGVRFDNPAHVRQIGEHCEANGIGVVMIDTLTRVHALDENDNSQMRFLFKQFSHLLDKNITVIVAHHDRKKGADSDVRHERMRGAGEIAAMADMAYSIDKVGHMFRLMTSKGRLVAEEDQISVDFVVQDNADKTLASVREVTPEEKAQQRDVDTEGKVIAALMDGPASVRELEQRIGGRKGQAGPAARRLADAGDVVTRKAGQRLYYALPGAFDDLEAEEEVSPS